jgi:hypothetical protein
MLTENVDPCAQERSDDLVGKWHGHDGHVWPTVS